MKYLPALLFIFLIICSCKRTPTTSTDISGQEDKAVEVIAEDTLYKDFTTSQFYPILHSYEEWKELNKILFNEGLISSDGYLNLQMALQDSSFREDFQFVNYLDSAIILNKDHFKDLKAGNYYKLIYDSLMHLAGFRDYTITGELEKDTFPEENYAERWYRVNISCEEGTFEKRNYYYKDNITSYGWIDDRFYEVINEILARKKSEHRLVMINKYRHMDYGSDEYNTVQDYSTYAFLLLNRDQYRRLTEWNHIFNLSIENYKPFLNRNEIQSYLNSFSSAGLIGEMDPASALNARVSSPEQLLKYDTRNSVCITADIGSYKLFINKLSNAAGKGISINSVEVENISAFDKVVRYKLNEKEHKLEVSSIPGELNIPAVVDQINTTLNKSEIDGNFYLLEDPESFCYVFLTEEKVSRLNELIKVD